MCISASAQEVDPNTIALQHYNEHHKPIVVSGEAMKAYRKTGKSWAYIEYEGILVGYAPSQNLDKIKNLIEVNTFSLIKHEEHRGEKDKAAIYITDDLPIVDFLSFYSSGVCNVKIVPSQTIKSSGFIKLDDGSDAQACKIIATALSVNDLEIIRVKENEFSLRDASKD